MVAYEALTAYPHIDVELLVTLGSPLAMPIVVFDRLDPTYRGGFGQRPAGVRHWANFAYRADLIAILRGGVKARFRDLDDDLETSVHWADFHTMSNYRRSEVLADILRPHLPTGRRLTHRPANGRPSSLDQGNDDGMPLARFGFTYPHGHSRLGTHDRGAAVFAPVLPAPCHTGPICPSLARCSQRV